MDYTELFLSITLSASTAGFLALKAYMDRVTPEHIESRWLFAAERLEKRVASYDRRGYDVVGLPDLKKPPAVLTMEHVEMLDKLRGAELERRAVKRCTREGPKPEKKIPHGATLRVEVMGAHELCYREPAATYSVFAVVYTDPVGASVEVFQTFAQREKREDALRGMGYTREGGWDDERLASSWFWGSWHYAIAKIAVDTFGRR